MSKPTQRDINRGLSEARLELATAKREQGRHAFDVAADPANETAAAALASTKSRIRALQDEIDDLASATSEAQRHETLDRLDRRRDKLEAERQEALLAIEAMQAKWADVVGRIADLGTAVPEFMDLHARANRAVRTQSVRHGAEIPTYLDNHFYAEPYLGGLLHEALGMRLDIQANSVVRDTGAGKDRKVAEDLLSKGCERARQRVNENFNRARTEITDQRVSAARAA